MVNEVDQADVQVEVGASRAVQVEGVEDQPRGGATRRPDPLGGRAAIRMEDWRLSSVSSRMALGSLMPNHLYEASFVPGVTALFFTRIFGAVLPALLPIEGFRAASGAEENRSIEGSDLWQRSVTLVLAWFSALRG